MSTAIRLKSRKPRNVRFVPAPLMGEMGARLEPRLLCKPAMYWAPGPLLDFLGSPNEATALATGGVLNVNTNSAGSGGTVSATAGGMFGTPVVTYTQTGLVTNQITDLPNPAGNYGTSIAVTQQHSQTVTNNPAGFGPPGGFLNYTSTATDVRNYTVADDGTGPVVPTVNLIETYSFAILGPATGNVAVTGGMAFAGVGFGAAAVYPAAPTYAVNTGSTLLSASWTNLGNHHTLNLMVSTPVTVGSVVSIANFTTLTTSLTNGSNISDMVSVAINYGAHF